MGAENRVVRLPKGVRDPESVEADQVFISPGATNLVMTTSAAPLASSREAMWWISIRGALRYRDVRRSLHCSRRFRREGQAGAMAAYSRIRSGAGSYARRCNGSARHDGRSGRRGGVTDPRTRQLNVLKIAGAKSSAD